MKLNLLEDRQTGNKKKPNQPGVDPSQRKPGQGQNITPEKKPLEKGGGGYHEWDKNR